MVVRVAVVIVVKVRSRASPLLIYKNGLDQVDWKGQLRLPGAGKELWEIQ